MSVMKSFAPNIQAMKKQSKLLTAIGAAGYKTGSQIVIAMDMLTVSYGIAKEKYVFHKSSGKEMTVSSW
jgi:enolase